MLRAAPACLFLLLAGIAAAEPRIAASPEDARALTQIQTRWLEAYTRGDIEALTSLYAPDAWLMNGGRPALRGRDAIRANFVGMMARTDLSMVDETEEIEVLGEQAHMIGLYYITGKPKAGGEPFTISGRYFITFRRDPGGAWRVYRDMDTPSPDAARLAPAKPAKQEQL